MPTEVAGEPVVVEDDEDLAGLDALEREQSTKRSLLWRLWAAAWPKLSALALALVVWELVVLSGWKPPYALPGPGQVLPTLADLVSTGGFWRSVMTTMRRAAVGYALSMVLGTLLGAAVSRSPYLRRAVGSLITGLQSMPSITWFPLAILLFQQSERSILFVVVLGATPSIANGLIYGIDHIPPLLLRAGTVMGAQGWAMMRSVILPAALPGYLAGMKQGWAFAWRSLMAGELLVIINKSPALGVRLDYAQDNSDAPLLVAYMIVILTIGIIVDSAFGSAERRLRAKRGLLVEG
ncbi:MAG: ABC transporter permease [Acidimicrobiales bacterium]